jgi:hypothetical protein
VAAQQRLLKAWAPSRFEETSEGGALPLPFAATKDGPWDTFGWTLTTKDAQSSRSISS